MGLIAGMNFIGDRTVDRDGNRTANPRRFVHFPHAPRRSTTNTIAAAAGPRPPFDHVHFGNV
jgi:hypothetical protein